jgi:GR25 family glycosyltransferase involved in LPS biosynthesis
MGRIRAKSIHELNTNDSLDVWMVSYIHSRERHLLKYKKHDRIRIAKEKYKEQSNVVVVEANAVVVEVPSTTIKIKNEKEKKQEKVEEKKLKILETLPRTIKKFDPENPRIPKKVYIIRINTDISKQYAKTAAKSCENLGLDWEYFEGVNFKDNRNKDNMWKMVNEKIKFKTMPGIAGAAACATASHILLWHKIMESGETAIVLEHDALMLNRVEIEIPDVFFIVLGYKVVDPENYHIVKSQQALFDRAKHGGAHAYAITAKTAGKLIQVLRTTSQKITFIDNGFFLNGRNRGGVNLKIIDPICALGWLRESTIWKTSAVDNYAPILESFRKNYKSKQNLGIKKP